MKKLFLLLGLFNLLSSCVQKSQYEILSPCVSADVEGNSFVKNPCIRRAVNVNVA